MSIQQDVSQRDLKDHTWLYAAALTGEEGRAWAEAFRSGPFFGPLSGMRGALLALRQGDIEGGRATLNRFEQQLQRPDADPYQARVFERFLCGVIAFDCFRSGDHEAAIAALDRGERVILEVLEKHGFLLALANIFCEFSVQRARVARDQRDWTALEHHLKAAREMASSLRPLCVLEDGREIFVITVADFFDGFHLRGEDRKKVEDYQDTEILIERFERLVYRIPMPRDFIIPYR